MSGMNALKHALSNPCERSFETLAKLLPEALAVWLTELRDTDATFAAEALGKCEDSELVRRTLRPLLEHPSPIVREGALYGIGQHVDEGITQIIRDMCEQDVSRGVRIAAADVLMDIEGVEVEK